MGHRFGGKGGAVRGDVPRRPGGNDTGHAPPVDPEVAGDRPSVSQEPLVARGRQVRRLPPRLRTLTARSAGAQNLPHLDDLADVVAVVDESAEQVAQAIRTRRELI